jgi:hypothetical protein
VGGGARASRDGGRTRKRMFLNVFEIGGCKGAVARAAETIEAAEASSTKQASDGGTWRRHHKTQDGTGETYRRTRVVVVVVAVVVVVMVVVVVVVVVVVGESRTTSAA